MTPAVNALARAGIAFELREYAHDPRAASYGLEAAHALGIDPASVYKTLLAQLDAHELVVAIVPVSTTLNLKALANAAGGKRAQMAKPADAQRATGYVLGGISPFGQKKRLRTVIDDSVRALATVHVSGGRRGLEIALAPADLIAATGAIAAPIASR
jgi:Cys-tRNA(Pro)/Cys-tRNA(Cys) deacylase